MTKTAKAPSYKQAVGMIRAKLVTEYQSLSHCALALNPITNPGEPEPPITPEILRARRQISIALEAVSDGINALNPLLGRPVEGDIYADRLPPDDNAAKEPGRPPYIVEGADEDHVSQYELQCERLDGTPEGAELTAALDIVQRLNKARAVILPSEPPTEVRELNEGLGIDPEAFEKEMDKHAHRKRIQMFGKHVLSTLTEDADWSADTMQEIANHAVDLGLAVTDSNGRFQEVQPGKKVYNVYVTLHDTIIADGEGEAMDTMLDLLDNRDGMEIIKHEIIERPQGEQE